MDFLDRLLGHDIWTTARLLEQSRGLSDTQLDQDFDLGHRTVRRTLAHIIGNMEDWTALMTAAPIPEHPGPTTLDSLGTRLDTVSGELARLARRIQAQERWDDLWTDTLGNPYGLRSIPVHPGGHPMHVHLPEPVLSPSLVGRIEPANERDSIGVRITQTENLRRRDCPRHHPLHAPPRPADLHAAAPGRAGRDRR